MEARPRIRLVGLPHGVRGGRGLSLFLRAPRSLAIELANMPSLTQQLLEPKCVTRRGVKRYPAIPVEEGREPEPRRSRRRAS